MAPRTEVETPATTQPAETASAAESHSETHSASPPPDYRRPGLLANPRARLFLVIAGIVVIVGGIFAWRYFASYESTDDAEVDGHLMPLSARISGYVLHVNVDDNQAVHKGDVLVEIDPRDYETALDQAKANLTSQVSSSQADIDNAQAGIVAARQQYDASQADLIQAQANNVKAQNDLVRYKQLVDKLEISKQLYDQAVAAAASGDASVAAAKANVAAADQQITQARARLATAEANLRSSQTGPQQVASTRAKALSAEADVQQKQAALEQAELNLQYTKIIAPVDGVISKSVEVGMNVQPGQQLLTIVPLNDVWVTANFKETQLKYMRPGQTAEIKVDANGRTYQGHVDSIANSSGARLSLLPPENATGNYVKVVQRIPVKIVLNPGQNSDDYLRLGMSVEPKVWVK